MFIADIYTTTQTFRDVFYAKLSQTHGFIIHQFYPIQEWKICIKNFVSFSASNHCNNDNSFIVFPSKYDRKKQACFLNI